MTEADPKLFEYRLTHDTKKWINKICENLELKGIQKHKLEKLIETNKLEIKQQRYKIYLVCYDGEEIAEFLLDDNGLLVCCSCNKYFIDKFERCEYCDKCLCYNCSNYTFNECKNAKYCDKCNEPLLFETECECEKFDSSDESSEETNIVSDNCEFCGMERCNMQDDHSLNSFKKGLWYHDLTCLNEHLTVLEKENMKYYKILLKHKYKILKEIRS